MLGIRFEAATNITTEGVKRGILIEYSEFHMHLQGQGLGRFGPTKVGLGLKPQNSSFRTDFAVVPALLE